MSTSSQVALLGSTPRRTGSRSVREPQARAASATLTTLAAFTVLALYATLRWSTMLAAPYAGRSLGLVVLALGICVTGSAAHGPRRSVRFAGAAVTALACLAMFPASGIPLSLILHARVGQIATLIGHGLGALPEVIVPYSGSSPATAMVIRLGAGMLLLGGALTVGTSRAPRGEVRLAAAALPMIVLATIPSCLAEPQVPYVHGVILFVLVVVFVFSERLVDRPGAGIGVLGIASVLALILTPGIGRHRAWISFDTLAGGTTYGSPEQFDWAQTYGPLSWPHAGSTVFDVTARFAYHWKAEDLDGFDGRGWVSTAAGTPAPGTAGIAPANLKQWTQTLKVTIRGLRGTQLIAAGQSTAPALDGLEVADPGGVSDEWVVYSPLHDGLSYTVKAYTPEPTTPELASAGTRYPAVLGAATLGSELEMTLPDGALVQFPTFGRRIARQDALELQSSAYAGVFNLSRQLARGASSPYDYVEAVLAYLRDGFRYTTDPRESDLPLVTFLLHTRAGYCQQFAGAMALLLRMDGIPARVAVGFTNGSPQHGAPRGLHRYAVTDLDAHAWVEAWFPGIGWATFDPTPSGSAGGTTSGATGAGAIPGTTGGSSQSNPSPLLHKTNPRTARRTGSASGGASSTGRGVRQARSSRLWPKLLLGVIVLISLGIGLLERGRRRDPPTPERLVAELERAFARIGRPLDGGVTLRTLEHRFARAPDAVAYLRGVEDARYSPTAGMPSRAGRRALRACLRRELGPLGPVRALFALPPRI